MYQDIYKNIRQTIRRNPKKIEVYEDGFSCMRQWKDVDKKGCYKALRDFRLLVGNGMQLFSKDRNYDSAEKMRRLLYECYKLEAYDSFDSYCLALEYDRPVQEQFYYPRRDVLKPFVDLLQKLADNELEEIFLSCPPRIGKTTLLLFYTTWMLGRDSNATNLYSSYSDIVTTAFYNGVNEILTDKTTYNWGNIFEGHKIARGGTNAKDETIDVDRKKHYPSLTCRSLYGSLNGSCDCNGLLIADDLLSGIEEAMNKDRLTSAWLKVSNNLLPRAKENAKILWCGTRWSIADPIGIRRDLLEEDVQFQGKQYAVFDLPALDENDESNFQYKFNVGFSTTKYRQIRAMFERNGDMASFLAQYMCTPIEREGSVFSSGEMRFFNGILPKGRPDRVFMAVDPAFGGGDFTASPVCVQYGNDIYVPSVVFNNGEKNVTQPLLVKQAIKYNVPTMQIEATKATIGYVESIQDKIKELKRRITVISKPANNQKSKEQRIYDKAPDIRENFIFLESGKRTKEYELFMQNVYSFKIGGKNKHDDAPDSLAQAADMVYAPYSNNVIITKRPF